MPSTRGDSPGVIFPSLSVSKTRHASLMCSHCSSLIGATDIFARLQAEYACQAAGRWSAGYLMHTPIPAPAPPLKQLIS